MTRPRPRAGRAASTAALAVLAILLAREAVAAVFAFAPAVLSLAYQSPPLVLYSFDTLDDDVINHSLGVNLTSFNATVKASSYPNTVCNPFIDDNLFLDLNGDGYADTSLCWVPIGSPDSQNTFQVSTTAVQDSYDSYGGSILGYNDTVFYSSSSLAGYVVAVQSFYYPGPELGIDDQGTAYIVFSYRGYASVSYGFYGVTLAYAFAAIYDAQGNTVYSNYALAQLDGYWHTVYFTYTPSQAGMSRGFYYLIVGLYVAYIPLLSGFTHYYTYLWIDTVGNLLPMQQGLYGIYMTAPLVAADYGAQDWTGWRLNASIYGGVDYAAAWFMHPLGWNASSEAAVYQGAPVEGGTANVTDTWGLGVLGFYAASTAAQGEALLGISYYHSGVEVEYPVRVSYIDPAQWWLELIEKARAEAAAAVDPAEQLLGGAAAVAANTSLPGVNATVLAALLEKARAGEARARALLGEVLAEIRDRIAGLAHGAWGPPPALHGSHGCPCSCHRHGGPLGLGLGASPLLPGWGCRAREPRLLLPARLLGEDEGG